MNEFDKELPYKESPRYVADLVERCASQARASRSSRPTVLLPWFYGVTAAVAAAVVAAVILFTPKTSPIDSFLASLSDDEAALIADWPITDIPDYY